MSDQAFNDWYDRYFDEAIEKYAGLDTTNPKGIAQDAWDAAIEADRKRRGEPVAYHPCTSILIEGLKRLPGGSAILAEWDKARSKVDAPQPAEPVKGLSAGQLAEILTAYITPEIIREALGKLENAPWELNAPVKVPSDAEMAAIWDEAHMPFGGAPFLMSHVEYSRALLARYGKGQT